MPSSKPEQPNDGWQPIEVSTERNGYDPTPIEVPIVGVDGGTAPAPKSGVAAKTKEN